MAADKSDKQTATIWFYYTWASYCLLEKQWSRGDDPEHRLSGFIGLPMQWLMISLILDNLRLFLGAAFGKDGVSVHLAQTCQFLRIIGRALDLSVLGAMFGILVDYPWLRYVGGAAAVFYIMSGLNEYVCTIHGTLVYKDDDDDVTRYTIDREAKVC